MRKLCSSFLIMAAVVLLLPFSSLTLSAQSASSRVGAQTVGASHFQTLSGTVHFQTLAQLESRRVQLPNGWALTPVGVGLPLGDLPLNIAVSRSGRYAAVTNNGQSIQCIQLFDARADRELDSVVIPKSWGGLVFSGDEQFLYASGGNDNWILKYAVRGGKLVTVDTFRLGAPWPNKISPAGICVDDRRGLLYVVTKEDN